MPYRLIPEELKAESTAIALLQGYGAAVRELNQRFGPEAPSKDTLRRWCRELGPEKLQEATTRRQSLVEEKFTDLIFLVFSHLEEGWEKMNETEKSIRGGILLQNFARYITAHQDKSPVRDMKTQINFYNYSPDNYSPDNHSPDNYSSEIAKDS